MDFRQLEYFEAVARIGSVSQAAKALQMTQPPLSQAITRLERELGVQLFERTAQGVRPTRAGRYLLDQGRRLIADRERIESTLTLMGTGLIGELRVAAEPMVIHEWVGEAIAELAVLAPNIRVVLTDVSPRAILEGVEAGAFDVGCLPFSVEVVSPTIADRFHWTTVGDIELHLAVPVARARERHPEGRGWGKWILPHRLPGLRGMVDAVETELAGDPGFSVLSVSTPQTSLPLVAAGVGVAPLTQRIAPKVPGVALLPAPPWMRPMRASVVVRRDVEVPVAVTHWMTAVEHRRPSASGRSRFVPLA